MQVQIAENHGEADLARARKQAEQLVVTAQAESQQRVLAGRGEGSRLLQVGLSEASVLLRKIGSFGDPRLYALSLVAEHLRTAASRWCRSASSWPAATARTAMRHRPSQGLLGHADQPAGGGEVGLPAERHQRDGRPARSSPTA